MNFALRRELMDLAINMWEGYNSYYVKRPEMIFEALIVSF